MTEATANTANNDADLLGMTADIVAAYVSNNAVSATDLPRLIGQVHDGLKSLGQAAAPTAEPLLPAVPPKKSVQPDFIICLEDGKKFKSLKRHLRTKYNLSPEEYRAKWNLPADYPMVCPNYSIVRSKLAKNSGLGTIRQAA